MTDWQAVAVGQARLIGALQDVLLEQGMADGDARLLAAQLIDDHQQRHNETVRESR